MGKKSLPSLSPGKHLRTELDNNVESAANTVVPPEYAQSIINQNVENDSLTSSMAKLKDDLNHNQRLLSQ